MLKVREQNFILETFKCCGWGTKQMHSQSTWKVASFLGLYPCPVFDCLQYMKTEEEGMVSISSHEWHQCLPSPDPKNELEAFFMLHWFHTTSSPALEFQTFVKRKMYHFWFKMNAHTQNAFFDRGTPLWLQWHWSSCADWMMGSAESRQKSSLIPRPPSVLKGGLGTRLTAVLQLWSIRPLHPSLSSDVIFCVSTGTEKLTVDSKSPKLLLVDLPSSSGEEGFMKQGRVCMCVCVRVRACMQVWWMYSEL